MKTMTKKTAVVALAGVMAAGMLTGCGEKELDGTKTVATVDGTEIPLGMLSLSVREGQAQAEAMYKSFILRKGPPARQHRGADHRPFPAAGSGAGSGRY